MAKTNIALYGISANPITIGHEFVARAVHAQCMDIDEVWISPCYHHQFGKEMAEAKHRVNMCRAVVNSLGRGFSCWEWEQEKQFSGTTWDFANLAEHQFPEYKFHFVIGMDNAQTLLKKWEYGKELIQKMPFIVVQRGNEKVMRGRGWWREPPHREINFQWPTSSTMVRDAIRDGDWRKAERNVHPAVWNIIGNHALYGCDCDSQYGYGR